MSYRIRKWKEGRQMVDIRLRLPDGKKIRERTVVALPKSGAEQWASNRVRLLLQGEIVTQKEAPTLADFSERFIENYAKANRQKHSSVVAKESILKHHLRPFLGSRQLDAITNEDVQALKKRLSDKSAKTVNNVLSVLGKMLKVAVEWDEIATLPCKVRLLKTQSKEMTFYEHEELSRLVHAAAKVDARAELVVLLGADAGLRVGEMLALEWGDIDLKRGKLTVCRNSWRGVLGSPKGGRSRRVPLSERLLRRLDDTRHLRGPRVLYRDPEPNEKAPRPIDPWQLRDWMERAQRLAGISTGEVFKGKHRGSRDRGRLHVLRHSFCSHLAMAGVPIRAIQELAGHQHITTTLRYMHLAPSATTTAIQQLELARAAAGATGTEQGNTSGNTASDGTNVKQLREVVGATGGN